MNQRKVPEELPTKEAITFMLADVEGSTRLWERDEEQMVRALADLKKTADEIVTAHHGFRPPEQGEGDSFVAAFHEATAAIAAAFEIQKAMSAGLLRLRMGIHTGDAQITDDGNYLGPTLNRAGRLREAAHGGQVVLSETTADLISNKLDPKIELRDLGMHTLRDLSRPERIFQLLHPELPSRFPALRTLDRYANNIPQQRTSFVGRHEEMSTIHSLVQQASLVTLTGPGGSGKTRLALQVAAGLLDEYAHGVFFVDFSPITSDAEVPQAVSNTLGLTQGTEDNLVPFLGGKELLLVLDNCEHVIEKCGQLCDEILRRAERVQIFATSREPLNIPGEVVFRVPTLPVPPPEEPTTMRSIASYAAVQLFVERASAVWPQYEPENDASAIGDICRRLDGIPLAIELAAARVRMLSAREIAERLDERFKLLTSGRRTSLPRQQTLEASLDWSYQLLSDAERIAFQRFAVFVGTFSLDAAISVCMEGGTKPKVIDLLTGLVDKSLILVATDQETTRYRMLETMREYGLERLAETGEETTTRDRHSDYFIRLAEKCGAAIWGPEGEEAFATLTGETHNLRSAMDWCRQQDDPESMSKLVGSLRFFLEIPSAEAPSKWLEPVLSALHRFSPETRAELVLTFLGFLPPDQLAEHLTEVEGVFRNLGKDAEAGLILFARKWPNSQDRISILRSMPGLVASAKKLPPARSWIVLQLLAQMTTREDTSVAASLYKELADLAAETGGPLLSRESVRKQMMFLLLKGEISNALVLADGLLAKVPPRDLSSRAHVLRDRADCHYLMGRLDAAEHDAIAALDWFERFGDVSCEATTHIRLALIRDSLGNHDEVGTLL